MHNSFASSSLTKGRTTESLGNMMKHVNLLIMLFLSSITLEWVWHDNTSIGSLERLHLSQFGFHIDHAKHTIFAFTTNALEQSNASLPIPTHKEHPNHGLETPEAPTMSERKEFGVSFQSQPHMLLSPKSHKNESLSSLKEYERIKHCPRKTTLQVITWVGPICSESHYAIFFCP